MQSASDRIHLFHDLLGCGPELNYTVLTPSLTLLESSCPFAVRLPALLRLDDLFREQIAPYAASGSPVILSSGAGMIWAVDYEKDTDRNLQAYHLIGPIMIDDVPAQRIRSYLSDFDLDLAGIRQLLTELSALPVLPITQFRNYGLMQHYCLTGEKAGAEIFSYADLMPGEKSEESVPEHSSHGTWQMEQELLKLIEEGNPDYRQHAARLTSRGRMEPLGNGDPLRHMKNTAIIFTSLCARAAIRGGLTPEAGYSISDHYINLLENASSFEEVSELNAQMQEEYVSRVHACRSQSLSPLVQNTCQYLLDHLSEPLNVPMLAKEMGYSVSYLARVFRKQTGMTLHEYQRAKRIERAMDALREGTEPVQSICHRLGFGSHSYFTEQFRKHTGMTPNDYRRHNGAAQERRQNG
ncbi:MAG: helix-turn-helix domain-containing protein [Lachnospiraceae bacterium]|nr:helix-turn-helix domain-containing protein [Lachnospiraceae bacterium]